MNVESFDLRERKLAEESFTSAAAMAEAKIFLDFPENVNGLSILDIGSGVSGVMLDLQIEGATSIGFDYRYGNLKGLKRNLDRALTDQFRVTRKEQLVGLPNELRRLTELEIKREEEYIQETRRRQKEFFNAIKAGKINLIGGAVGSLPLKNNSIDFAFSLECLSRFVIKDEEVFVRAIEEAIRVLKPGGELQLYPWDDPLVSGRVDKFTTEDRHAATVLTKKLREEGILHSVEPVRNPRLLPRLRITKPL